MSISGSATTDIDAPIQKVYEIAADAAGAPRWQPEIKSTEVLERDAQGQQVLVEMETDLKVKTIDVVMRFSYDEPNGLSWVQQKGALKSVEGSWSFEDLGNDRTRATYEMTVDLGRALGMVIRGPLVGLLRGQLIESMPEKLKGFVETH